MSSRISPVPDYPTEEDDACDVFHTSSTAPTSSKSSSHPLSLSGKNGQRYAKMVFECVWNPLLSGFTLLLDTFHQDSMVDTSLRLVSLHFLLLASVSAILSVVI